MKIYVKTEKRNKNLDAFIRTGLKPFNLKEEEISNLIIDYYKDIYIKNKEKFMFLNVLPKIIKFNLNDNNRMIFLLTSNGYVSEIESIDVLSNHKKINFTVSNVFDIDEVILFKNNSLLKVFCNGEAFYFNMNNLPCFILPQNKLYDDSFYNINFRKLLEPYYKEDNIINYCLKCNKNVSYILSSQKISFKNNYNPTNKSKIDYNFHYI